MTRFRSPQAIAVLILMLCGFLASLPAVYAQTSPPDPAAVEKQRRSLDYVAGLEQFSLDAQTTLEAVMLTGQKIQYANAVQLTVKRPNKMLAVRSGELVDQAFYYDGSSLTLSNPSDGVYATVAAPGTLDAALDFARDTLDIVAPAGDLIYQDAFDILMQGVQSGFVVGTSYFAGTPCDHLAFSAPGTDWQIWIQRGDQPLPRKMVITSRDVISAPQFTVEISDWNLTPEVDDNTFRFTPTEDSKAIEFAEAQGQGK
jgi:hypothetical protein